MPPRASRPVGIALARQAGRPVVVRARRRAAPPHRRDAPATPGTLDPFATGLLVLMSGAATRLAPCFVGLDKRYVTEIDLTATTTTGDPEGEVVERHAAPAGAELDARLEGLRGEVELPIPAALRGEDRRRARLQARAARAPRSRCRCAARRSTRSTCSRATTATGHARRCTSAPGTYVRSIAEALGGHCRTLRRTAVGPFRRRGGRRRSGCCPSPRRSRGCPPRRSRACPSDDPRARARGRGGRSSGEGRARTRRARAAAARGRDRHLRRRPPRPPRGRPARRSTPGRCRPSSRSTRTRARCSATRSSLLSTLERRLELLAELGVEETLVVEFTPEIAALEPEEFAESYLAAIGAEVVVAGDGVPLRPRAERRPRAARAARLRDARRAASVEGVSSTRIRQLVTAGDVRGAAALLGRPVEVEGTVVSGEARGGTLGFPTANLRTEPTLLVPRYGIYAGAALGAPRRDLDRRQPALRRRRAQDRGVPARLRRRPLRRAPRRRALGAPARRGGVRQRGRR